MRRCIGWSMIVVIGSWLVSPLANAAVGRTAGTFDVSAAGAATYQIPIWVPPGPRGVQPSLSIAYNSQSGNGFMGPGWSLSGLSSIARCNKTIAQDGAAAPVALAVSDGYCMDGNRLRVTSATSTYGAAESTYQTEAADFSNITAKGAAGNGPAYFIVQRNDGLTYEYGNSSSSLILPTGSTTAIQWLLNKVTDRSGNNYIITYSSGQAGSTGIGVPDVISYTPSSSGSTSYNYSIKFNYDLISVYGNGGAQAGYTAGSLVRNTSLLTSISVRDASQTTLRKYAFDYQATTVTARARLITITECTDEAKTDCLSPTTVTYQDGQQGVANPTAVLTADSIYQAGDINGDGRPDVVYVSGGVVYVAFANATGIGAGIPTGIPATSAFGFGDLTGSGSAGIFARLNGAYTYYTWNTASGSFTSTLSITDPSDGHVGLADLNGDGLPDLVYYQSGAIWIRLNTSTGGVLSFNPTPTVGRSYSAPAGTWFFGGGKHVDINGDGREDIVIGASNSGCGQGFPPRCDFSSLMAVFLTGGPSNSPTISDTSTVEATGTLLSLPKFLNLNDDKCTDILTGTAVYISACNGSPATKISIPTYTAIGVLDWDGDGHDDILVNASSGGVVGNIGVYLLRDNALVTPMINTNISMTNVISATGVDQNGDKLSDLSLVSNLSAPTLAYGLHFNSGITPDLAISIKDGYGVEYKPTYTQTTAATNISNYTKGTAATGSEVEMRTPVDIVSQVISPDGIGGTFTQTYTYTGAREDISGRGFLGFQSRKVEDSRADAPAFKTYYKTTFPQTGMEYQQDVFQHNGTTPVLRTTSTPAVQSLDGASPCLRCFAYFSDTTTQRYELSGQLSSTTVTSFGSPSDSYGNFTNISTAVTDNDAASPYYGQSWTTNTTSSVTADPSSNWCLNRPSLVTMTRSTTNPSEESVKQITSFGIDPAKCRVKQQIVASGTIYQVTTDYKYDDDPGNPLPGFGNISSVVVTGYGMAPRTTQLEWTSGTSTTGQFPMKVTNALGQATMMDYNFKYGRPASQTDANGITTLWHYDTFARRQDEIRPDGTATYWSYSLYSATSVTERLQVSAQVRDNANVPVTTNLMRSDIFDRSTVSVQQLLNGKSVKKKTYDALGRLQYSYFPYDAAGPDNGFATYSYDALGRLILVQRPINAGGGSQSTGYQYNGRTTIVTDAEKKRTTIINDVNGWLRRSQDHNNYYQSFGYDAFGSLKSVIDSQSYLLFSANYVYGLRAFQTSTHDMDMGDWGYTPDALGEVVAYTDNKLAHFSATYDALSRLTTRTEPSTPAEPNIVTTWIWGSNSAEHNIGKLKCDFIGAGSTCPSSSTYMDNYSYDSIGRLSDQQITSDETGHYNYTYASNGLVDTLTYPSSTGGYRLKLQYSYQNGMLQNVKDYNAATIFWQANAMNPRGQLTQEQLGNGIIVNQNYDAVTGWINFIQCGAGGGACSQNNSYTFDKVGNLSQRQNPNLNLTENFYYDNVNRLSYSTLTGYTGHNLDMGYDDSGMGNIKSRSDVSNGAVWTYDNVHKHQVLTAGSNTYTYDQNGNLNSRNGNSITWTSYNYPSQINGSGEAINLYYDANRQRYKQIYNNNGGAETTLYIGGLTQKVSVNGNDDYRYIITANGKSVAIISCGTGHVCSNSGPNVTRYVLSDHQGSVVKFTDGSGNAIVSESFSAFGARRNPQTWSGQPTYGDQSSINSIGREGYTGQTALGNLGLNHMNGRVQDAITGRFLSPDPYVTEPTNTQNYNRYSYVYNNPLSLMDPTGYSSEEYDFDDDGNGGLGAGVTFCIPCGDSNDGSNDLGGSDGSWSDYARQLALGQSFLQNSKTFAYDPWPNVLTSPITLPAPFNLLDNPLMDTANQRAAYLSQAGAAMMANADKLRQRQLNADAAAASGGSGSQTLDMPALSQTQNQPHRYEVYVPLGVCLSKSEGFDVIRNFSAPAIFHAQDGTHEIELAGGNWIQQTVDPVAMTITNVAIPGRHVFGGYVNISMYQRNGVTGVHIEGGGSGPNARANQFWGPKIFEALGAAAVTSIPCNGIGAAL